MNPPRGFRSVTRAALLCAATLLPAGAYAAGAAPRAALADAPVLLLAEDEDAATVRRSSEVARRVAAALKRGMSRAGFRVMEEEAIAGDLKWRVRDRRLKTELLQLPKLMAKSGRAEHQVRVLVLFRTRVTLRSLPSVTRVQVRIESEIHDVLSNEFITGDDAESPVVMLEPLGGGCDAACVSAVSESAARAAGGLGAALAGKLARNLSPQARSAQGLPVGHAMPTNYTVTLRYFERREALAIIGVMAEEFPGYRNHSLISQKPAVRRYSYVTTAKPHKMEEWLAILLRDMNFDVEKEIVIRIEGNGISLEKIFPTPGRARSKEEMKFTR